MKSDFGITKDLYKGWLRCVQASDVGEKKYLGD